ncbi:MAG: metal ABC transporter permease [Ruminococcaceae bacterium]|nr:metal ABC transporter permease [Oscillospiraceae bacterium]
MHDLIAAFFGYDFLSRALLAGVLIALCAALLGVSLVLKNYALIGDGLSHVGFGALAIAAAANLAPLAVSVPIVVAAAFLLLRIRDRGGIRGDSAIALVSTSALAAGVLVTSLTGMNTDISAYLFGSILAMSREDVIFAAVLSGLVLILYILFYHKIFTVTFDESFARATGTHTGFYDTLLSVLTAVTVVLGMRLMGTLLISSLIIFPALSAMRVCRRFFSVIVVSAVISVVCVAVGLSASYLYSLPAGASVVAANAAVFVLFALTGLLLSRIRRRKALR